MTTIWLLRRRCLKFNWWHFCYAVTDAVDRVVAYQFVRCESSTKNKQVRANDDGGSGGGDGNNTTQLGRNMQQRFQFNCDKNLQWIQTVGCYSRVHFSFSGSTSISRHTTPRCALFTQTALLSCLLYSLFFMLHLSIWNVGGTYRILNKFLDDGYTDEKKTVSRVSFAALMLKWIHTVYVFVLFWMCTREWVSPLQIMRYE